MDMSLELDPVVRGHSGETKRAVYCAMRSPSVVSLEAVTQWANSCEQGYSNVLEALHNQLDDTLTDNWERLANGLDLVAYLLDRTPQLMADLSAEPGMLRALLGFWAEDEGGMDCGEAVRSRAAHLLGRLEDYEQQQLERQWQELDSRLSSPMSESDSHPQPRKLFDFSEHPHLQQQIQSDEQHELPEGGLSQDSCFTDASPLMATVESGSMRRAARAFTMPSLAAITCKLPKLRLGRSSKAAATIPSHATTQGRQNTSPLRPSSSHSMSTSRSSGSPGMLSGRLPRTNSSCGPSPLSAGRGNGVDQARSLVNSGGFGAIDATTAAALTFGGMLLRSGLPLGSSSLRQGGIKRWKSKDLVQAWGQIRGQSSHDFARMMQQMDDDAFDAEHARFSTQQGTQQQLCLTAKR